MSNIRYMPANLDPTWADPENFSRGGGGGVRGIIVFAGGPFFGKFTM